MMLLLLMSTMGLVPAVIGLPASNNDTPALQSRQASSFPYGTNKVRGVNLGGVSLSYLHIRQCSPTEAHQ
jgi:hypothetical protein